MNRARATNQSKSSTIILLLGLAAILLLFDVIGVLSPFQALSDSLFNPPKYFLSQIVLGVRSYVTVASSYGEIAQDVSQNRLLQKRVLELEQKTGELASENVKLRQMLEAPVPAEWKLLPASVLGISRTMVIDQGRDDGVQVGMTVVDGQYYVGAVVSVEKKTAHVRLPFDAESRIASKTSRGTRGFVVGSFGEKMELTDVLQSDGLFLEDTVSTTGEDGLGQGLLLGTVAIITATDTDPYKSALLTPLSDSRALSTVFVLLSQ